MSERTSPTDIPLLVCANGHGWRTVFPASFAGWPCRECGEPLARHCTGDSDCKATRHTHGCFADFGSCDRPEEHE